MNESRSGVGFGLSPATGRALAQMNAIIDAQGRRAVPPPLGALTQTVCAATTGTVLAIDNQRMARIASLAGAPLAPGAGVDLLARVGDAVQAGQPLYRLHAQFDADLGFASALAAQDNAFRIGPADAQTATPTAIAGFEA